MDAIFKALSDDTRRLLLDRLRERDGQTLTELEAATGLTRFGVMKHLKVLEAAGLVLTHKAGRFKYHYLNGAPLQSLVDRWLAPLTQQPMARAMLDLKAELERKTQMSHDTKPSFMLETFIRATPAQVWEALTSPDISRQYMFKGTAFHSSLRVDEPYEYRAPDGRAMVFGTVLEVVPDRRLALTYQAAWMGPEVKPSRVVHELAPVGELTRLTIAHYDLPEGHEGLKEAWAMIAASLKSLLETGTALAFG
ncbi:transcriptional regulator, ArsR family [Massilia sp. PDC64]|nr:SRPBCC domain-containing protein [Massilia sp. PDC64]SDC28390.1 transcriptional regulator, ArsR family [Massilia sp. PDC64]